MASSNTINDFYFDLQMSPTFGDNFQFVDALTLLKNPESLNIVLTALLAGEQPVDLNKEMSARQALWAVVALNAIHKYIALLSDELGSKVAGDRRISEEAKAGFPFLRGLSDDASWQSAISLISGKMARPSVDEFARVLKSTYKTIGSSKVIRKSVPDFKNQILLAYPRNAIVDNFDKMSRRYVTSGANSLLELFAAPETPRSQDFPMVAVVESNLTPKGAESAVLIGFNDFLVGSGGSSTFTNSVTQGAIFDASARLQSMNLPAGIIDPSPAQKKEILESAASAVVEMHDKGEFSPRSAAEMLQMIDASAQVILDDPSSPYHGKGYTEKDIVAITTHNLLGSKGENELLSAIVEGLDSCVFRYHLASANLAASSDTGPFASLFFESQNQLESAVEDYDTLLSYASILFDIKAPDFPPTYDLEEDARENAPQVVTWTVVIGSVILIVYSLCKEFLVHKEETAKELYQRQRAALQPTIDLISNALKNASSTGELDAVFKQVKGVGFPIELIAGDPTTRILDCQGPLREGYAKADTFEGKKTELERFSKCLEANDKALVVAIDEKTEKIEGLKEQSVLQLLTKFIKNLLGSATSVLKYAMYTALGLGVLWGGVKVYRSLKSDSDP